MNDEIRTKRAKRRLGYGLTDLLVVAACCLAFTVVIASGRHGEARTPPIVQIAQDLGTTPEAFKEAADRFLPHHQARSPTDAQKRQLAIALDISVEQLDMVMAKYRPDRLRQR